MERVPNIKDNENNSGNKNVISTMSALGRYIIYLASMFGDFQGKADYLKQRLSNVNSWADGKRAFYRFMTKLGAHISHLAVNGGTRVWHVVRHCSRVVGKKAEPAVSVIHRRFVDFKKKVFYTHRTLQKGAWELQDGYCDRLADKGVLRAVSYLGGACGKKLWTHRRKAITVFNWAAPVLSISLLVGLVNYTTSLSYGVEVECNGQTLGMVAEEGAFEEAARTMQAKINYIDGAETVTVSPRLSVRVVQNASELVGPEELADKLIVNTDAVLARASGVYVDGEFLGAVADKQVVQSAMEAMLDEYEGPGVKSVRFNRKIHFEDGAYLEDNLVNVAEVLGLFNSDVKKQAFYTVEQGDTPIIIASSNGLTLDELLALNPGLDKNCKIGDKVTLNRSEPYLPVAVVKSVTYKQKIAYEVEKVEDNTIYEGNQEILVKGDFGEQTIIADVTSVGGYEVGRKVVSSSVTKEPVKQKIAIGTKIAKPAKGVTITGSGQYAWPVAGGKISAWQGDGRGHKGMDIAAPAGTSIFAASSGKVIRAGWDSSGYGNAVLIQNDDGNVCMYAHQSKVLVNAGDRVEKGEIIGLVGTTGDSTGNHLHIEVRRNGAFLDPAKFIM